jgi:hypothetical protein
MSIFEIFLAAVLCLAPTFAGVTGVECDLENKIQLKLVMACFMPATHG